MMFLDVAKKPGDPDAVHTEKDILAENARLKKEVASLRNAGDAAAFREAVEKLLDVLYDIGVDEETTKIATGIATMSEVSQKANNAIRQARAALAAPARNCDVGTAAEQYARFKRHCKARHKTDKPNPCGRADRASNPCAKCYSMWAQMPYKEKEESNGSK